MILQLVRESFSDTQRITVALKQPTQPQSRLLFALRADRPCAATPVGEARYWRCANTIGTVHTWHKLPAPQGGTRDILIEAAREITGSILVIETARLSTVDALQLLADLLLGGSPGEPVKGGQ